MAHGVAKNDEDNRDAHDEETSLRGHDGKLIEREKEGNWKVEDCCEQRDLIMGGIYSVMSFVDFL